MYQEMLMATIKYVLIVCVVMIYVV